ncbi:hypothetical protein Tco_0327031 [Tanacetum coccineum]
MKSSKPEVEAVLAVTNFEAYQLDWPFCYISSIEIVLVICMRNSEQEGNQEVDLIRKDHRMVDNQNYLDEIGGIGLGHILLNDHGTFAVWLDSFDKNEPPPQV